MSQESVSEKYTLIVHGGTIRDPKHISENQLELIRNVLKHGKNQLASGSHALDIVVDAIVTMENSGLYDAGKGSYLNTRGFTENDASLVDGMTGRAGAVALLRQVKNPIKAAKLVMEQTPHVLLAGATGEETLIGLGAEIIEDPDTYFSPLHYPDDTCDTTTGTVGAVALDRQGRLVAGTSTGGTRGKLPGRISDSAIIGAGTYADKYCAISTTGVGEYFIRRSAAFDIARRSIDNGKTLQAAADHVIHNILWEHDKAPGGIIGLSSDGDIALSCNVYGMIHGYVSNSLEVTVGVRTGKEG